MAASDEVVREKLAEVFARQDFFRACQQQDAGTMITILNDAKIPQTWIAAKTGIAQSTLRAWLRT